MKIIEEKNLVSGTWKKLKDFLKPIYFNGFNGSPAINDHEGYNKNLSQFD